MIVWEESVSTIIYFENHKSEISARLKKAKKNVKVAVAWINFKDYYGEFSELLSRGVTVEIVCSDNPSNRKTKSHMDLLIKEGARIIFLKMPSGNNHMHHKFCVIDEKIVINGSFNWSKNALKNFENLSVLEGEDSVVTKFIDEFQRLTNIDTKSIKAMQQAPGKCKNHGCKGDLLNLWIFSENVDKYDVLAGDIIQFCAACEDGDIIESCVQDATLATYMDSLACEDDDHEREYLLRSVSSHLNGYSTHRHEVHAIGRVRTTFNYLEDEIVKTEIIWKNKFVENRIKSEYDGNFGVCYDMES